MAKRKFGRYTVDYKKISARIRPDRLIETQALITGDIEIGIQIDPYTWRGDWLAKQAFGKEAGSYRLLNVQNEWVDGRSELNHVTAVWEKEER